VDETAQMWRLEGRGESQVDRCRSGCGTTSREQVNFVDMSRDQVGGMLWLYYLYWEWVDCISLTSPEVDGRNWDLQAKD
jgi:hypothetical protein